MNAETSNQNQSMTNHHEEQDVEDSESSGSYSDKEIVLNDEDVWDDSLLIKMYEESQKKISEVLLSKNKHNSKKEVEKNVVNNNNKANNNSKTTNSNKKSQKSLQKKASPKIKMDSIPSFTNSLTNQSKPTIEWNVGDYCRLIFLQDNIEYEAKIMSIHPQDQICLIRYIGYENEEWRMLSDLKASAGDYIREMQIKMAKQDCYGQTSLNEDNVSDVDAKVEYSDPTANFHSHASSISFSNIKQNPKTPQDSNFNVPRMIPPPPPFFPGLETSNPDNRNQTGSVNEDDALASMLMSWYMTGYHTGYYQAQKELRNKSKNCTCNCCSHPR